MRQAMNFRFTPETILTLTKLEKELHTSKTAVLEQALYYFAKKNKLRTIQQPLLQFAGKISARDANDMLKTVTSRKNKKKDFKL